MANTQVFLDANTLIYALDATSEYYGDTVPRIQKLVADGVTLCTSHHVIEEVVHIAQKISNTTATEVVHEIGKIPDLVLVEPDAILAFAERYSALTDKFHMGVNDALLLQLMLDAGISRLFSYDKRFVAQAVKLGIEQST